MFNKIKRNPQLFTIFLVVFVDLLGFGLILPLLPFIGEKYGATPLTIGLLAATYSFFQLISSPILGKLSDRYGRKPLLIISQVGTAIGYIILGTAHTIPLLFLSRAIDGITGGNISIAQAYIADVTTKENRAKGMGLIGAAFGLGFIIGPAVGGLLSSFGFWAPAAFATIMALITVVMTIFILPETVDTKKAKQSPRTKFSFTELKNVLGIVPLRTMIITFLILNLAFSGMQSVFPLWAQSRLGLTATSIGFLFTYIGIIIVIVQLQILPRFVKRFKEFPILKYAILLLAIGLGLIGFAFHIWFLLIAMGILAFGNGLANPIIQSISSKTVPPEDIGGTLGIVQSAGSLGRIFGPILGGLLFGSMGISSPLFIGSALVFGIFIYLSTRKYYK